MAVNIICLDDRTRNWPTRTRDFDFQGPREDYVGTTFREGVLMRYEYTVIALYPAIILRGWATVRLDGHQESNGSFVCSLIEVETPATSVDEYLYLTLSLGTPNSIQLACPIV